MNCEVCALVQKSCGASVRFAELALQPLILLIFRVYWGLKFYHTGMGKLENHANVVEFFTALGIPLPGLQAWFVGGLECVGGLLLLLGLCSRPIAFMLSITMVVAYATSERDALLNIFNDAGPFLQADPFLFLLTTLLVLAFGPGVVSLDALIKRGCCSKKGCGEREA